MLQNGLITQEEALSNADSATNLLWMINNTQAGGDVAQAKDRNEEFRPARTGGAASFSDFKLDVDETERA